MEWTAVRIITTITVSILAGIATVMLTIKAGALLIASDAFIQFAVTYQDIWIEWGSAIGSLIGLYLIAAHVLTDERNCLKLLLMAVGVLAFLLYLLLLSVSIMSSY